MLCQTTVRFSVYHIIRRSNEAGWTGLYGLGFPVELILVVWNCLKKITVWLWAWCTEKQSELSWDVFRIFGLRTVQVQPIRGGCLFLWLWAAHTFASLPVVENNVSCHGIRPPPAWTFCIYWHQAYPNRLCLQNNIKDLFQNCLICEIMIIPSKTCYWALVDLCASVDNYVE